ncbi:MAG TPA: dephospho-CoA kinase [Smithella sp.]|nr:dephospho-CoA kinase [Smithella sp.]HRS97615.1 dephospho-CoA kinase [Smithella sp.]
MLNVGLTGGIACGKSTVARMLSRKGAYVIDFDKIAHEVQKPRKPAWQEVVACFGKEILDADLKIDRLKLGNIVFADKKKLQQLNKIVHPFVYEEWNRQIKKIGENDKKAIIIADVPLLFEGKMQHLFDVTILVLIEPEEQIRRLIRRNQITEEEARKRLASQLPIKEKVALADLVIDNRGSIWETQSRVDKVWQQLKQKERQKNKATGGYVHD